MHLVIKKITINDNRIIEKIEISFDESTTAHFLGLDPSANDAEGSFSVHIKKQLAGQSISFAI